jgi:ubiquinone/menaquinone biosynthesis C-methylase UbiE
MDEQVERVRDVFDSWAASGRGHRMAASHSRAARVAFDALSVKPGERYLDIGCGVGFTVRWAASVDPSVDAYGIDVSSEMIAIARDQSAVNTRFIHAPFPLPMLKGGRFDAVFSMEVFYYLPDLGAGLAEVVRLLAPGGRFACVVDFYAENEASHRWPDDLGVAMTLLSEAGWREAFAAAGLTEVRSQRLRADAVAGEPPTWKQTEGSLMVTGVRG